MQRASAQCPPAQTPAGAAQDAHAAIERMETGLAAALRRISKEPGREHDLKELDWLGGRLWEAREALEAHTRAMRDEARRQLVIAQAFAAGEAAGMARAGRRDHLRPVPSLPDTWAG